MNHATFVFNFCFIISNVQSTCIQCRCNYVYTNILLWYKNNNKTYSTVSDLAFDCFVDDLPDSQKILPFNKSQFNSTRFDSSHSPMARHITQCYFIPLFEILSTHISTCIPYNNFSSDSSNCHCYTRCIFIRFLCEWTLLYNWLHIQQLNSITINYGAYII